MPAEGFRRRSASEPPRVVKVIAHRTWFLLIPLIAFSWVSSKQLTPKAEAIAERTKKEEEALEKERLHTLAGVRVINTRVSQIRALADTFKTRFDQLDAVMDTAAVVAAADRERIASLQRSLDSLRAIEADARTREAMLADSLALLDGSIDSLKKALPLLAEEARRLEAEAQANRDLTDRVLNPAKYRKNSALIIGDGAAKQPPPAPPPKEEAAKP